MTSTATCWRACNWPATGYVSSAHSEGRGQRAFRDGRAKKMVKKRAQPEKNRRLKRSYGSTFSHRRSQRGEKHREFNECGCTIMTPQSLLPPPIGPATAREADGASLARLATKWDEQLWQAEHG